MNILAPLFGGNPDCAFAHPAQRHGIIGVHQQLEWFDVHHGGQLVEDVAIILLPAGEQERHLALVPAGAFDQVDLFQAQRFHPRAEEPVMIRAFCHVGRIERAGIKGVCIF